MVLAASAAVAACSRSVLDARQLRIGSSPTGVPFSFVDPWSNELTGSMVDTAALVARAIGRVPDLRITSFGALIPSLTAGKIDLIAAAMLRTPEREAVVSFSSPVYSYSGALVVPVASERTYPSLVSLRGLRVGAQIGTRFVDQLRSAGVIDVSTYDGLSDILRDLGLGRIDVGYGDQPILAYQLRVGPKRPVRLAEEFAAPAGEALCLVVRKGDPLLAQVDLAIERMRASDIPEINRRWGLEAS